MAGGCQTAGERPYFNSGTSHIKKGVVGLGHMQEAHRNLSFRRACSAPLQAGILGSSTCSPEGERYTLALGLLNGLYSQGKDSKGPSPAANYTPASRLPMGRSSIHCCWARTLARIPVKCD